MLDKLVCRTLEFGFQNTGVGIVITNFGSYGGSCDLKLAQAGLVGIQRAGKTTTVPLTKWAPEIVRLYH